MIAKSYIEQVLNRSSTLNVLESHIHGLDHWLRVWRNAQQLVLTTPDVDMEVVAMFALFHDSMRINDHDDPQHGSRGYELYKSISRRQNDILSIACVAHSTARTHSNPTIGLCWDADRLDLPRVGITPDVSLMSTHAGQLTLVNY